MRKEMTGNKLRRIEIENELPHNLEYEGGKKKKDEELAEKWQKKLQEREERFERENTERERRLQKASRLKKVWQLIRLCRELIEENGEKWQKSSDRRETERKEQME